MGQVLADILLPSSITARYVIFVFEAHKNAQVLSASSQGGMEYLNLAERLGASKFDPLERVHYPARYLNSFLKLLTKEFCRWSRRKQWAIVPTDCSLCSSGSLRCKAFVQKGRNKCGQCGIYDLANERHGSGLGIGVLLASCYQLRPLHS